MDCGLFHLMEDFILKEIDYSRQYGYSSRAKRYMRRKLNKQLAPFIEDDEQVDKDICKETDSESETDADRRRFNESLLVSSRSTDLCLGIAYVCFLVTFYGSVFYVVQSYSNEQKTC
jgi:hypothetical protein